MSKLDDLVNEIKVSLTQTASSNKDEERVMRLMLNDRDFKVDIFDKEGKVDEYSPAEDVRGLISSVISNTTKISLDEAKNLANDYDFKKAETQSFIRIGKEFINTYLQTGRKLPLGSRELSDVSLSLKNVEGGIRKYPRRVGVNPDGTPKYEPGEAYVKPHQSIRVHASCPPWVE